MRADSLPLKTLFQRDVRYVIPTFQRPYVWNQDDQWEPLWNDVRNVAEQFIDQLRLADGNVPLAEERTGSHFLGAVVFQQRPTASRDIDTRDVIDGQQRMTTLQLFLDAAQQVMEDVGARKEAAGLSRLVVNAYADGDDVFKLWPTALDQPAFRAAMRNDTDTAGFEDSLIVQAHDFFRLQIREWLDDAPDDDTRADRIRGLETALFGLLELVVIDLSTGDDAHAIFETLNARGTPLLASDLVKNFMLQRATGAGIDAHALYEREWKPLEDPWWRKETRQGRLVRPRIDIFLNYWLTMRTAAEVPSKDVFETFKAHVDGRRGSIEDVAADIRSVAAHYRHLDAFTPHSREGTFLYRWNVVDAGSSTPVLLWIFSQEPGRLSPADRIRCLETLESFLVRRMLCRLTTKDYNRLFLDLLGQLVGAGPERAPEAMASFLRSQQSESRRWPDDGEVIRMLLDSPMYRLLTRGRVRFVLEAVEESMRGGLSEQAHVPRSGLNIEHVMPQSWRRSWPLPPHAAVGAELDRDRLLHSIGNLTLVNPKLNTKLSNDSWSEKRRLIAANAVFHLNKEIADLDPSASWSEETIRARSEVLAARVCTIWPVA